jgi:hypothetical protein
VRQGAHVPGILLLEYAQKRAADCSCAFCWYTECKCCACKLFCVGREGSVQDQMAVVLSWNSKPLLADSKHHEHTRLHVRRMKRMPR